MSRSRRLRFAFEDEALEQEFRSQGFRSSIATVRSGLVLALVLYGAFGLLDYWMLPESHGTVWLIRFAVVVPFLAGVLAASFHRRFNVVLHPITNPDGARLAVELQKTNPDFMLHAGYLGALGVDATSGERDDDPMYPESQARRRLRETWLPDIAMNMHGYPSHEWVQYFAGYSAWVRSRRGAQRSWWAPRGWFIPGLGWSDDDEHPEYREAQFAVLDSIASAITGSPEVEAVNRRLYARYRKYGIEDRDQFREYFHDGILVNLSLRGGHSIGTGLYSDRITWFDTTTEAPDETARGDWLEMVATAGLAHSTALLRYLATGTSDVEREAEAFQGVVTRKVFRVKPVLPGG